ncbi:acyltransferase family protein [Castellaniella sp. S9]|uniref:acyltransferase family protein n=1 Tax=Castellaniella sp. S9 TaxID=2993652 RepID=UPI0022B474EB|nr:acyltransferase family protein [Castellaniella sp. S9]
MNSASYRPDVQGLRAIAVLAVVLFHYENNILPGGYVGVDIFLVISGYLITQQLYTRKVSNRHSSASYLLKFYAGRIKRIIPAYFVMLATITTVAKILFTSVDYRYFADSLKATALFVSNQYFSSVGDYFAPELAEQPLLHTWSLSVEMQFYLLLPVLVLLMAKRRFEKIIPFICLSLVLVAEWRMRVDGYVQETYFALYSRAPEFLAGSWLAVSKNGDLWRVRKANVMFLIGIFLVLVSLFSIDNTTLFPGLSSVMPVVGAILIISAKNSTLNFILSNRPMVWVGFLSYSIYLWHWSVLAIIRYYSGTSQLDQKTTIIFILSTLIFSCLSFYLIEEPARKSRWLSLQPLHAIVGLVLLAFISLIAYRIVIISRELDATEARPIEYTRYADPATICHGEDNGHCIKGDASSSLNVAVIGDSHAAMLNQFFDYLGKSIGFKATIMTASSCVPFPGFNVSKLPEWAREGCHDQIERVSSIISQSHLIFIGGMWSYQLEDPSFKIDFERFLASISGEAEVFLLSQVPELSFNPLRIERFAALGLARRDPKTHEYKLANDVIRRISKSVGAKYVELDELSMFGDAPYLDKKLIYMDKNHLNEIGVREYAKASKTVIRNLITNGG